MNASILYEELSKDISITMTGSDSRREHLHFPLIFQSKMDVRPDHVYVGLGSDFPEDITFPDTCCIVSAGPLPDKLRKSRAACLVTNDIPDRDSLFNRVQQVFERYNQWAHQLNQLIQHNAGIQEILNHSQPLFEGNFFLILDVNYHVLATTSAPDFVMDENGNTPSSVLVRFKKDPEYARKRFHKNTYLYRGVHFDHDILTHHIFINDELSGTFALAEHGAPITDARWTLFEHLTGIVDRFYQQRFNLMHRDTMRPAAIFSQILSGHTVSDADLKYSLESANWEPEDQYVACFVEINESDKKIVSIPYLCQQLESMLISAVALEFNTDIVVVLNTSKIDSMSVISKQGFRIFLSEFALQTGVSNSFHDLLKLKNYYLQARAALEIGHRMHPEHMVYHFSTYLLTYMVGNLVGAIEAESLCPEGLLALRRLDRRKGSEYIKTLGTYFRDGFNASQAAKDLYINRSTFLERMKKIREMIGLDLEDYDVKLYLMLCMKLIGE